INYAYWIRLNQLNRSLAHTMFWINKGQLSIERLVCRVSRFLHQHWTILKRCIALNRNYTSNLYLMATFGNVSINIYFITNLIYRKIDQTEWLFMIILVVAQVFAFYFGVMVILPLDTAIYRPCANLYRTHFVMGSSQLRHKYQLLCYCEMMQSPSRFRFTNGV